MATFNRTIDNVIYTGATLAAQIVCVATIKWRLINDVPIPLMYNYTKQDQKFLTRGLHAVVGGSDLGYNGYCDVWSDITGSARDHVATAQIAASMGPVVKNTKNIEAAIGVFPEKPLSGCNARICTPEEWQTHATGGFSTMDLNFPSLLPIVYSAGHNVTDSVVDVRGPKRPGLPNTYVSAPFEREASGFNDSMTGLMDHNSDSTAVNTLLFRQSQRECGLDGKFDIPVAGDSPFGQHETTEMARYLWGETGYMGYDKVMASAAA